MFFDAGKWNLEYELIESGRVKDRGGFKAESDGSYGLNVPRGTTGYLRIKCLGGWAYHDDEVTVRLGEGSADVVVHAPELKMREK